MWRKQIMSSTTNHVINNKREREKACSKADREKERYRHTQGQKKRTHKHRPVRPSQPA